MAECPYCEEFKSGRLEWGGSKVDGTILYESKNFNVFPTLGQIVDCYLLIATKDHFIGIGEIQTGWHRELNDVGKKVRDVLKHEYGQGPLFFEHGPAFADGKNGVIGGGGCIDHAYLHAVPTGADVKPDLDQRFR